MICSSTCIPISGLKFGSHFSGWLGRSCKVAAIFTAPGLVHGLCASCAILVTMVDELEGINGIWVITVEVPEETINVWVDVVWGDEDWEDEIWEEEEDWADVDETIVLYWFGAWETIT